MGLIVPGLTRNDDGTYRMVFSDGKVVERCHIDVDTSAEPIIIRIEPIIPVEKIDITLTVKGDTQ